MKKIYYLLRDKGPFQDRNTDSFEDDYQFYINDIKSEVSSAFNIKFTEYDYELLNTIHPDIIICEDTFAEIRMLLEKIVYCDFALTILIIDDLSSLKKLYRNNICKPKIMTLDFLYISSEELVDEGLVETLEIYADLKSTWPHFPVIGISNFKYIKRVSVENLIIEFKKNRDQVFDKSSVLVALPEIIENVLDNFVWDKMNTVAIDSTEDKGKLVSKLNKILAEEEYISVDNTLRERITKYLDIQEYIVAFALSNSIRLKSESLAAAMLYYEKNPDKALDGDFLKELYNSNSTTKKKIFNDNNLPSQPLAAISKYFKPTDENDIISKGARIIISLIKSNPKERWHKSVEYSKTKSVFDQYKKTFLDSIIGYFK